MLKTEFGSSLYQFVKAAATLSFTPRNDRAAKVTTVSITSVSATDTWVVTCKGKEILRYRIRSTGSLNPVQYDDQAGHSRWHLFEFCRQLLNYDPSIPVPNGQTFTVASLGGATANIFIEYSEVDIPDVPPSLINHPDGKTWIIPITTFLGAAQSVVGPTNDDTQVGPSWLPNFLIGTLVTSAWNVDLLAAFMEGVGVNTFSGAANHQSTTNTKGVVYNSRRLFSQVTNNIPNLGAASAAGSANTVTGQVMAQYQPFDKVAGGSELVFPAPLQLRNGDTFNVQEEFVGDLTGGADYSGAMTVWIAKVQEVTS